MKINWILHELKANNDWKKWLYKSHVLRSHNNTENGYVFYYASEKRAHVKILCTNMHWEIEGITIKTSFGNDLKAQFSMQYLDLNKFRNFLNIIAIIFLLLIRSTISSETFILHLHCSLQFNAWMSSVI